MAQHATILWFTGLSGAGKSTLASGLSDALAAAGHRVLILDGDDVRNRLHRHLGFSPDDIRLNNQLIAGLCAENRAGFDFILVPIISPYRDSRAAARKLLEPGFHEIFVSASLDVLHDRDTKGLYAAAKRNEIGNLIGVSPGSPYDIPDTADLVIDTGTESLDSSRQRLLMFAMDRERKLTTASRQAQ
jgi:adenylylsulfate kinase